MQKTIGIVFDDQNVFFDGEFRNLFSSLKRHHDAGRIMNRRLEVKQSAAGFAVRLFKSFERNSVFVKRAVF